MNTFKKKDLNEIVGGDISSNGGDRNVSNNSEIETGPVAKSHDDESDYEKGMSTTTDKVFGRYRQNIPWFAVYSWGNGMSRGIRTTNENSVTIKKNSVEEKIDDLVKKSKNYDLTPKGFNPKVEKMIDAIKDCELTDEQLVELQKAISDKKNNSDKSKTL